jgi:condensin complex subunit 2
MPKFGDVGVQGGPPEKQPAKRVVSALAVQAGAKKGKRLSAVGVNIGSTSAPMVSMEVMNNNFEEWMKLATDNVSRLASPEEQSRSLWQSERR